MTAVEEKSENSVKHVRSGCLDKFILVVVALGVCISAVGSFLLAEYYHVNYAFVFFAWNSILLLPIVGSDFRKQLRKPSFMIFFLGWMVIHGFTIVGLTKWADGVYWIPVIFLELFVGYFIAYFFFDVPQR